MVGTDEEIKTRTNEHKLSICDRELAQRFYPQEYYDDALVEGKWISAGYLTEVQERGSEVARFSFMDAIVLFSKVPPHFITFLSCLLD